MHVTPLAICAAIAAVLPLAQARNCDRGLIYCGSTLLDIGDYGRQIRLALREAGQPTTEKYITDSLFYCLGENDGDVAFQNLCEEHCIDAGHGHDDYCS